SSTCDLNHAEPPKTEGSPSAGRRRPFAFHQALSVKPLEESSPSRVNLILRHRHQGWQAPLAGTNPDGTLPGPGGAEMPPEAAEPGLPAANSCARSRRCGRRLVVEVFGEVDIATAELLAEHLLAATAGSEPDVLVDLRRLDFLDCSGL